MTIRRNIKIVAGSVRDAAMLSIWEKVGHTHSVEVLALQSEGTEFAAMLPVTIFPEVPEMAGYYRDLDRYLAGADLIVGVESSRLSSFQALRAARKLGVPYICLCHESVPFAYEGFKNIRAIQHDIFLNADALVASSRRASQLLRMEGVPDDRVRRIQAVTDPATAAFSVERAAKFRRYIGVPDSDIILTVMAGLDDAEPVHTLLQGIRLGLNQVSSSIRGRLRILICGQGQAASQLKYQVSDMGLGPCSMFIAQDVTPFLQDLLSASDYLLEGRFFRKGSPELLPWHVLSASTCGAKVMTSPGSLADDWLSGQMVTRFEDFAPMEIAMALADELKGHRDDCAGRLARAELAATNLSPQKGAALMLEIVAELCTQDANASRRHSLSEFVRRHQVPVTYKDAADVLVACEEAREFAHGCETGIRSEVLRIKGDALAALARGDEALVSFEESLRVHGQNHNALRGLGYLAWNGHSHEEALRFFKRALAVNPNDYQCLVGVGLVYRRLKMFGEAVFWLQKAIAVGGLESSSLGLLVQACLENSEIPEALDVLLSVRESLGEHPALMTAITKLESHQ
jgi:tetratricopeptide (TPR) repeat protein